MLSFFKDQVTDFLHYQQDKLGSPWWNITCGESDDRNFTGHAEVRGLFTR
jgi:hypothetical protein